MRYLLDTNVVSEIMRPQPDFAVICWVQDHSSDVVLSSIGLEEIYHGVFVMPEGKRKKALKAAIDAIVRDCTDRVLGFDAFCGYLCAEVRALAKRAGRTGTIEDFMIAAICLRNNVALVTRNVKDFDYVEGLEIVNPFAYESPVLAKLKRHEAQD